MNKINVFNELMALAPEIHQVNKDKGLWPENRNKGEQLMLVVSELGECLDAHREGRNFNNATQLVEWDGTAEGFTGWFAALVKDTVQDEMADVVIRMLDYIYGWSIPLPVNWTPLDQKSKDNFGDDLLTITRKVTTAGFYTETPEWGGATMRVMDNILSFCEWYHIDILQHVRWKFTYNKTRGHKHGKAY